MNKRKLVAKTETAINALKLLKTTNFDLEKKKQHS